MLLDTTFRSAWAASMPVKAMPNDIKGSCSVVRWNSVSIDLLNVRQCDRAELRRVHRGAAAAAGIERDARHGAAQIHLRRLRAAADVRDGLEAVAARGRLGTAGGAAIPGE